MIAMLLKTPLKLALACSLAVVFGLSAVSSADAAHIRLLRLYCLDPQDPVQDEVQLRIKLDAGPILTLSKKMKKGDCWMLNKSYSYKKQVLIRLFDVDPAPNPDDLIGARIFGPAPTGGIRSVLFNFNGAQYRLVYSIVP